MPRISSGKWLLLLAVYKKLVVHTSYVSFVQSHESASWMCML